MRNGLIVGFGAALATLSLGLQAQAAPISAADVFADWSQQGSVIDGATNGVWTLSGATIQGTSNHVGSLISDFTAVGDFSFSAQSKPSDNDAFGLIWGFQDLGNNYRFSWARDFGEDGIGASADGAGGVFDGFKIIKEVGGVSSVLFASNTEYTQNNQYDLEVSGVLGGFNVTVTDLTATTVIFNQTIADTTFTTGKVGLHEFFQQGGNVWQDFEFVQGVQAVPVPAALPLMASVLAGIGFVARRRKS